MLTQVLGNPSSGVFPSYKQRFPRAQRLRRIVVKCSPISCKMISQIRSHACVKHLTECLNQPQASSMITCFITSKQRAVHCYVTFILGKWSWRDWLNSYISIARLWTVSHLHHTYIATFRNPGMFVPNHHETRPKLLKVTSQCRRPF